MSYMSITRCHKVDVAIHSKNHYPAVIGAIKINYWVTYWRLIYSVLLTIWTTGPCWPRLASVRHLATWIKNFRNLIMFVHLPPLEDKMFTLKVQPEFNVPHLLRHFHKFHNLLPLSGLPSFTSNSEIIVTTWRKMPEKQLWVWSFKHISLRGCVELTKLHNKTWNGAAYLWAKILQLCLTDPVLIQINKIE